MSEIIRKAYKKLDNPIFCRDTKIKKHKSQKPRSIDYNKYIGADISALTQREKEIFLLRLSGVRNIEIAQRMEITQSAVSVMLCKIRNKIDGNETYAEKYYQNNKGKFLDYQKSHPEMAANARKKSYLKNREKRLEEMRKYNREYYQKHKEAILQKRHKKSEY